VRPDEGHERADAAALSSLPRRGAAARMHEPLYGRRDEAVVHEKVFGDVEVLVTAFEVAGSIPGDPVPQRQVLGASRRPNGIGLNEAEMVQGGLQRARREEAAGHGGAAQIVESHKAGYGLQAAGYGEFF
jgi:hypothetical protein